MEKITNHKARRNNPGSYFSGNLVNRVLHCDSCGCFSFSFHPLYIPHGGFLTRFNAAYISPLLTPWGLHLTTELTKLKAKNGLEEY